MKLDPTKDRPAPETWAIGGGKGGVGKSLISTLLAISLAQMGNRVILMDADLGGANLHILLGLKSPERNLNDFLTKKAKTLEETCLETEEKGLRLISGSADTVQLTNLTFTQKNKIISGISKLDADHVVMDLGAGASFNVLDFFLAANHKIVVLTPQPTSIQNAYTFIRSAVFRSLIRISNKRNSLQVLIKNAMNADNSQGSHTVKDLLGQIELEDYDAARPLKMAIKNIHPILITNMARDATDCNAGRIVQVVAEKYLTLRPVPAGTIVCDRQIEHMISKMTPLTRLDPSKQAINIARKLAMKLSKQNMTQS